MVHGEHNLLPFAAPYSAQLSAVGTKYGIENVGPLVQFEDAPTA